MIERNEVLSISRQCALLSISRSSVYYESRGESTESLALMRRMDALSLQYPFYGSRQMSRHLRREGVAVGRRRVRRLMRVMGLEAIYRKPRTSVAEPDHRIYPYLLRGLTIDRPNQVWCSDITYIPVSSGFLYLVAIMDWASRHVLAWRLSNTMDSSFCVDALEAALQMGTPEIFNTDQGSQFTSTAFTERVLAAGRAVLDGRPRAVLGQRLHRAVVAVAEVRGGVSSRAGRRVRGRAGYRGVDDVLRLRAPALRARGTHAGRGLRRGAGGVSNRTTVRGTAMTAIGCSAPRLATAVVERPLLYDALIAIADTGWRFDEQTNAGPLCRGASRGASGGGVSHDMSVPHVISGGGTVDLPGCGRPRGVASNPKVGEAGAHNPWKSRGRSLPLVPAVPAARFPQPHSASSSWASIIGNDPCTTRELATVSADLKTTRA